MTGVKEKNIFSLPPLICQNFHNLLHHEHRSCLRESCVMNSLLQPSSHSTRRKNKRKRACWQRGGGVLYIWKSHQLSLLVSLSAALLPPHRQTSLSLLHFFLLFSHVYSVSLFSVSLTPACFSCSLQH